MPKPNPNLNNANPSPDAMVRRAEQIARAAHAGQQGKTGEAYITHPERVVAQLAGDARAQTVGWLHDLVEDTNVTLDELAREFPPDIIRAVDAISRRDGESDGYYARVAADPLALKVKRADIADNSDPARRAALRRIDPAQADRLDAKYAHASRLLNTLAAIQLASSGQQRAGTRGGRSQPDTPPRSDRSVGPGRQAYSPGLD